MTSPLKIEDGQQPDVAVNISFKFGKWQVQVEIGRRQVKPTIWAVNADSFEDAISKVRNILDEYRIK